MHSKQCLERGSDNIGGSGREGFVPVCEEKEEIY